MIDITTLTEAINFEPKISLHTSYPKKKVYYFLVILIAIIIFACALYYYLQPELNKKDQK